ncbi:MAG: hypothetical protein R3C39_14555 [Dehalococcoidia bacterium]
MPQLPLRGNLPLGSDSAQDTLEYLLTVASIVVAVILGLLGFDQLIQLFVGHLCPSVDTANPLVAIGTCITS